MFIRNTHTLSSSLQGLQLNPTDIPPAVHAYRVKRDAAVAVEFCLLDASLSSLSFVWRVQRPQATGAPSRAAEVLHPPSAGLCLIAQRR